MKTLVLTVHGFVQGVGYRAYVKNIADKNNIKGSVENMRDGSVKIIAQADKDKLDRFSRQLRIRKTFGPDVFEIEKEEQDMEAFDCFTIL